MFGYSRFRALQKTFREAADPKDLNFAKTVGPAKHIISCYQGDFTNLANPGDPNLIYFTTDFKKQRASEEDKKDEFPLEGPGQKDLKRVEIADWPALDDLEPTLFKEAADMIRATPNHDIYIIGHSYGGWTAMQLVLHLNALKESGDIPDLNIAGLVTVDPISPEHCHPEASTILSNSAGCTSFPPDINGAKRATIRDNVKWWRHYYQGFIFLHSDAMPDEEIDGVKVKQDKITAGEISVAEKLDQPLRHIAVLEIRSTWNDFVPLILDEYGIRASRWEHHRERYYPGNK